MSYWLRGCFVTSYRTEEWASPRVYRIIGFPEDLQKKRICLFANPLYKHHYATHVGPHRCTVLRSDWSTIIISILVTNGNTVFKLAPSLARSTSDVLLELFFFCWQPQLVRTRKLAFSLATKKALEKLASTLLAPTFAIHSKYVITSNFFGYDNGGNAG